MTASRSSGRICGRDAARSGVRRIAARLVEPGLVAVDVCARHGGATPTHEVPIQLFGGGFGRHIELTAQRIAAKAILPQSFGVRLTSCVQLHQPAMRRLIERFERDETGAGGEGAVGVVIRSAEFGESLQRFADFLAQRQSLVAQPLIERGRARVEAVEQIAAILSDSVLERGPRTVGKGASELEQIAVDDLNVDADGFSVREQRRLCGFRQRLAHGCKRLPQARACKFFVRVLP